MPLVFPPAPNAYFTRAKEQQTSVFEHKEETGFRYYPLMCDSRNRRGDMPVSPLQSSPVPPHRMAPLQHLLKPPQTSPMSEIRSKTPMIPPMPQQMFPPMHPPMSSQSTSPQKAAEQFHQMNQNLPDGVKYEPLDDEIMKILRGKITPSEPVPPAAPTQPVVPPEPSPPLPSEAVEILKGMAQCEKSMYAFFKNFPDNAELTALAENSEKRLERLTAIIESPG